MVEIDSHGTASRRGFCEKQYYVQYHDTTTMNILR